MIEIIFDKILLRITENRGTQNEKKNAQMFPVHLFNVQQFSVAVLWWFVAARNYYASKTLKRG